MLWVTEVTERHRAIITVDELAAYPHLAAALRAGRPIEDGTEEMDQLYEYAAGVEGSATEAGVDVTDRTVTIEKEQA